MARHERLLLLAAAATMIALRFAAFFHYRFDSDEQQHLHVAWAWTAGLLPYRDVFDNHTPLFHMLTAPMLVLVGERADVLLWMRAPMLILFGITLWATFALGRTIYDERTAVHATLILALFPPFFLKSLEYRNDNLWTTLSILAFVGIVRRWRPAVVGLLLGCALAASIKTVVLLLAIGGAAVLTAIWSDEVPLRRTLAAHARALLETIAGFALVPAAIAIYFASAGAWRELVFGVWTFNSRMASVRTGLWLARAAFPLMLAIVLWLAWRFRHAIPRERYFLALVIALHTITLWGFWVLVSPRDFLAIMPLAAIFLAAALTRLRKPLVALATVFVVFAASIYHYADRLHDGTQWHVTMMNQVLRLTRAGEPLIDYKGETIFRRRPFYYALEVVTRTQIARGMIRDTIPEDIVRTRTHVAQADGPMWPPRGRAFLSANFLDMGRLRASGQWIADDGSFSIAVPGRYVVVNAAGIARGWVDGTPLTRSRVLSPGAHRFVRAARGERVAVLWAPAFERGHSPFHLRDREF